MIWGRTNHLNRVLLGPAVEKDDPKGLWAALQVPSLAPPPVNSVLINVNLGTRSSHLKFLEAPQFFQDKSELLNWASYTSASLLGLMCPGKGPYAAVLTEFTALLLVPNKLWHLHPSSDSWVISALSSATAAQMCFLGASDSLTSLRWYRDANLLFLTLCLGLSHQPFTIYPSYVITLCTSSGKAEEAFWHSIWLSGLPCISSLPLPGHFTSIVITAPFTSLSPRVDPWSCRDCWVEWWAIPPPKPPASEASG